MGLVSDELHADWTPASSMQSLPLHALSRGVTPYKSTTGQAFVIAA